MSKNGGKAPDIVTLEEALRRFKHMRSEGRGSIRAVTPPATNPRDAQVSTLRHKDTPAGGEPKPAGGGANASVQHDEANAPKPAGEEIVVLIDGVPRTLEQLEQMEAAEKAYRADFPASAPENAGVEDLEAEAVPAARHGHIRGYALVATSAALMGFGAFLMIRPSVVSNRPNIVAQTVARSARRVSSLMRERDLLTTFVLVSDSQVQSAWTGSRREADELELRIKNALKLRAFPDIGVSVSEMGDAYLAGEVYGLDEARKIAQIVRRVSGVNSVHFLHPDVLPVDGPAYFGVTATWTPEIWGAKVQTVFVGSPADKAGVKPGDVISEFDGKTVPDAKTFDGLLAQYSPGQRVQLRVWHDGQPEYLVARLGETTMVAIR